MSTRLFQSLSRATKKTEPWEYFIFGQCLSPQQIEEIKNADIDRTSVLHDGTRSGYKDGEGKQNHKFREYVTKDNWEKYPELTNLIKELQSEPIREMIAKMVGNNNNFKDSYVRLEVLNGIPSFTSEHSPAKPVSLNLSHLDCIEEPHKPDREQWLYSLLGAQFTLKEMQSGHAYNFLQDEK